MTMDCRITRLRVSLGGLLLVLANAALADSVELEKVRNAIKEKGLKWTARETSVSRLSPELRPGLLSTTPSGPVLPGKTVVVPMTSPPVSFDWRNVSGNDYVTPVRTQISGNCTASASESALESAILRMGSSQGIDIHLSPHPLWSCPNGDAGNLHGIAAFMKATGLPTEACYPDTASDDCGAACAGWPGWHFAVPVPVRVFGR
jgi:hypothetical protein